jgi:hypothetical protein
VFSVEVDRFFAVTAALGSTEGGSAAMRTIIAFLLLLYPLLRTELPPSGDTSQYNLLADRNREIIDEPAGELVALMASLDFLFDAARLDRADPAIGKDALREAAVAYQVLRFDAVNRGQLLFKFLIVVPGGYMDSANSAVQTAWRCKFLIDGHDIPTPSY